MKGDSEHRLGRLLVRIAWGLTVLIAAPAFGSDPGWIEPGELKALIDKGADLTLVNAMSPIECLDHRIPGSICLPAEEVEQKADRLPKDKDRMLVFYCEGALCHRSTLASDAAGKLGYTHRVLLKGGLPEWKRAGYETESVKRVPRLPIRAIKPAELKNRLAEKNDLLIIDVRSEEFFEKGHIEGAVNAPFYRLHTSYPELPRNRPVLVVDQRGFRSFLAASYLAWKGFPDVTRLFRGMVEWERFGRKKVKTY